MAKGKARFSSSKLPPPRQIHVYQKEVHVFEIGQKADVEDQANLQQLEGRQQTWPVCTGRDHGLGDDKVEHDRTDDERHVIDIPPTIEKQTGTQQPPP